MLEQVYVNGSFVNAGKAGLGLTDLGILRGYGVFDYFRYSDGQPRFLGDHLDRFVNSAGLLNLAVPRSHGELSDVIYELIARNQVAEGGIRMVLTGGYAEDGYTPTRPNLVGIAYPHHPPAASLYANGCKVMLHRYQRQLPQAKTIDYIEGIRIQPQLRDCGAQYPVYVDRLNQVKESDRSNIMIVSGETLITPIDGILAGITRKHILRLAHRLGLAVSEAPVSVEQLLAADEAIICSSIKGLLPISEIAGRGISPDRALRPGKVTARLMELWPDYLKNPDR